MKPTVACIFAHPDDEAFMPAGTIATLAKDHDIYIICATSGDAGENPLQVDLAKTRRQELNASASILGVKKVFFLDYKDGTLNNNSYHSLAADIQKILDEHRPETLLTFEPRGVTGHIDHIVISMVSSYLFERLSYTKKILYYCNTVQRRSLVKDYFIYFPQGYREDEIDMVVDIESVWDKKIAAIQTHKSQPGDVERVLASLYKLPKKEYFLVKEK